MYGIPYVLCRGESCMNKSVLTPKTAYLLPAHYYFNIYPKSHLIYIIFKTKIKLSSFLSKTYRHYL